MSGRIPHCIMQSHILQAMPRIIVFLNSQTQYTCLADIQPKPVRRLVLSPQNVKIDTSFFFGFRFCPISKRLEGLISHEFLDQEVRSTVPNQIKFSLFANILHDRIQAILKHSHNIVFSKHRGVPLVHFKVYLFNQMLQNRGPVDGSKVQGLNWKTHHLAPISSFRIQNFLGCWMLQWAVIFQRIVYLHNAWSFSLVRFQ